MSELRNLAESRAERASRLIPDRRRRYEDMMQGVSRLLGLRKANGPANPGNLHKRENSVPESAITIENVTKTFGSLTAVDGLNLDIPTESVCGFLGPNGAGKSTTIRMIMSIYFPDSGEIRVLGKKSALESKDQIGYLPEERGLYRKMKVGDFLQYMARLKGVDGRIARKLATEWLERVELPEVFKRKCEELSKGMQQKVQVIAAIIHNPDLIILDEPFSGLDPVNAKVMRQVIDDLHKEGKTIIFSTHVLFQAEQLCDRIFMIHKGVKVLDDTLEGIRRKFDPRTIVVKPSESNGFDPQSFPGVSRVEKRRDEYEVHLKNDADPYVLMRQMLDASSLRKVELKQPSLDDVFVRLVEGVRISDTGAVEVMS